MESSDLCDADGFGVSHIYDLTRLYIPLPRLLKDASRIATGTFKGSTLSTLITPRGFAPLVQITQMRILGFNGF